ncbi:hypothetical protein ABFS82_09G025100 [Erythranthe guttata]|uniref:FBD-associated F-box protein At4g10400-like n=1 Tax=Erythranthe guttata TaxID=4155 RepID=UPI00064E14A8|nr:PREDICTED: FBD-associated F-box protein At4g10400-like [Erythranthe guttata]|eukprot:XP_012831184.1 PREDICTED: FBD-associated F-box protein At4g10400-like [Erythranthe guttata]
MFPKSHDFSVFNRNWVNSKCTQDSINRLPDELLISIVSHLPVKEAIKTSVIARRWRYFWKCSSILDFDGSKVLFESDEPIWLRDERRKFATTVNKVLDLHSLPTIEQFRIAFDLDQSNADDIGKWLQFAFAKRVKRLELNLAESYIGRLDKQYSFPNMCDTIERLRILPSGCESLVALCLIDVDVTEETLEFFVSNCPLLEELRVRYSNYLKKFAASSPLVRLKRFEIASRGTCKSVEICTPNLLSFAFYGILRVSINLKNVSSLISLSVGAARPTIVMDNINQISGSLSRLETLKIRTSIYNEYVLPRIPDLHRLKKLVLDVSTKGNGSLLCFTSLLNAAPLLRELVLKLNWSETLIKRRIYVPAKGHIRHQCLEVLEIQGFAGADIDAELALYVIENAPSLKRIIIDFRRQKPDVMGKLEIGIARAGNHTQMAMATEGVLMLKSKLSAGVELIINQ